MTSTRRYFCALLALTVAAGASAAPVLLVGNKGEDTLSFIDLPTGRELARVPTGKWPHEIAISPDGKQAAVVSYGAAAIDLFDVSTRKKLGTIDLSPNAGPHGIAWLRPNRLVATTERSQSVALVDPQARKLVGSIKTNQAGTHMIAVTRNGRRGFTANIPAGTVSVLDLARRRKIGDIAVGGRPEGIALTVDDRTLWVGDLSGARVQAFDARTFRKKAEVATGRGPIRVLASPDGRWIVTSNYESGNLTLIDARTMKKVRDLTVSGSAEAGQVTILFGPRGLLYAAETGRNEVAEIDLAAGKVLRRIKAGEDGDGLAIAP